MKAMELAFSTIAMLVTVLVVLVVVLVFYRSSIEEVGAKFGLAGQEAGESAEHATKKGGSLDISNLLESIKVGKCESDDDCTGKEKCGYVCLSNKQVYSGSGWTIQNACFYYGFKGRVIADSYDACAANCGNQCGPTSSDSDDCTKEKRCADPDPDPRAQ